MKIVGLILAEISFVEGIAIGIMIFIFGLIVVIANIWMIWQRKRDLATSLRAKGQVMELVGRSGNKGRTIYAPRVAFQTAQNQMVYFVSPNASSPSPYRAGNIVEVYYNPQNPNKAGLVHDSVGNFLSFLYLTLGILMMLGGAMGGIIALLFQMGLISFK